MLEMTFRRWLLLFAVMASAHLHAAAPVISSGTAHTLALTESGQLVGWGSDVNGQLGVGRPVGYFSPQFRLLTQSFQFVASGELHKLAIDDNGEVWTWGLNDSGQLGLRNEPEPALPDRVLGFTAAVRAAAGSQFSAIMNASRQVWVMGRLTAAGPTSGDPVARRIPEFDNAIDLAAGRAFLLVLKADGSLWGVGSNSVGMLGNGTTTNPTSPIRIMTGVRSVAASGCSAVAIMNDGSVKAWGSMTCSSANQRLVPTTVTGLTNATSVAVLTDFGFATTASGQVFGWDDAFVATLKSEPVYANTVALVGMNTLYMLKTDGTATSVAVRAATSNGSLTNLRGELCGGDVNATTASISAPNGIRQIASGASSVIMLSTRGRIAICGNNQYGQSGDGNSIFSTLPRAITVPGSPTTTFSAVAAGSTNSYAVDSAGQLYAWGYNTTGSFGTGNLVPTSVPTAVPGVNNVAEVASGSQFSMIRKVDGSVWFAGTLGLASVRVFTRITLPRPATAIVAGGQFAYALLDDRSVYTLETNPVLVSGLSNIVALVGTGGNAIGTFLARTATGGVFGWGYDFEGQLCQGSTSTNRATPVLISSVAGASAMTVSDRHSMFVVNGEIRGCGSNTSGQLALTVSSTTTAQSVPNIFNVSGVSAGRNTSFAFREDGTVYSWGGGGSNQLTTNLGTGGLAQRLRPGLVRNVAGSGVLSTASSGWALDLKASTPNFLPPGDTPRLLVDTTASGTTTNLTARAKLVVRDSDVNRTVNVHVLGLLPRRFITIIQNTLASRRAPVEKADSDLVLVQLTPTGWQVVTGPLTALTTNVLAGNQTAVNILNNLNASLLTGGGSFCVGYGSSANDMINQGTLAEALTLPGAAATSEGLPCLRSGAYVTGPATSTVGQAVSFNATVIGVNPAGTVTLVRDGNVQAVPPTPLAPQNAAVATAVLTPTLAGPAAYNLSVVYPGDGGSNPASTSQAHQHSVVGVTTVNLTGPTSSNEGSNVTFTATVPTGATGTIQFRDQGANLGAAVTIAANQAQLTTSALAVGAHTITAFYEGNSLNSAATSTPLAHTVNGVVIGNPTIALSSGSGQSATVNTVFAQTLRVLVRGPDMNPLPNAQVTFGGPATGPSVSLSAVNVNTGADGTAQVTVTAGPDAGAVAVTATIAAGPSVTFNLTVNAAVVANPTITLASGSGQSAAVNATFAQPLRVLVRGPDMNPLPNVQVAFSRPTNGPSVTLSAVNVNTGADGTAQVTATAGPNAGAVAVTATIAAGPSVTFNLTINPVALDPNGDADNDGIPNGVETSVGTNPQVRDNDIFATTTLGNRLFIMQQFRDFLNREGDAGGIAFWEGEFTAGRQTRSSMVETFFNSAEFQATGAPMARLYFATYLRIPDYSGLVFWTGQFRAGQPLTSIGDAFASAPEFVAQYGTLDNAGYVNRLYQNILGRPADSAGLTFWVGQLNSGVTRGAMLTNFSESAEYRARINNSVYVTMMYVGMLRRGPDQGGFDFWRGQMDGGRSGRDLIDLFIPAPEYRARFL
jgi:alpha-tubulin suppressor-like RCC1 family protein